MKEKAFAILSGHWDWRESPPAPPQLQGRSSLQCFFLLFLSLIKSILHVHYEKITFKLQHPEITNTQLLVHLSKVFFLDKIKDPSFLCCFITCYFPLTISWLFSRINRCAYVLLFIVFHWCSCVCVCVHAHTQLCLILCDPTDCSLPGSSVHGIFQARNTRVGCHFLLQGIFLTQGSNPSLLCLLH